MITTENLNEIRALIPRYTGAKRLSHTLSVEEECVSLAALFGLSPEAANKLCAAALLHDVTKKFSHPEQLAYCRENGIPYTALEERMPKIFHARTGAQLAAKLFPEYADAEVCRMIARHTTAYPAMTLSEALLYLADYIEPKRTFDDCVRLRAFFYGRVSETGADAALAEALVKSFDMTVTALIAEGGLIHEDTNAARNYYLARLTADNESTGL